jgi:hypothetical protein
MLEWEALAMPYQLVGANLVGGVAVGRNAISAHDNGSNPFWATFEPQQSSSHGVCDESGGDLVMHQFVSSEP